MMLSINRAGLLAILILGSAAGAQDPGDQVLYGARIPPSSLSIPQAPPCVDGALLGRLRKAGTDIVEEAGIFHGRPRTWFEFDRRRTLFGSAHPASVRFSAIGENPYLRESENSILLVRDMPGGAVEMVHVDVVIPDRRGRDFIPLLWAPVEGLRGASWLPLGFEAFARRVRYDRREMAARGHASDLLAAVAGAGSINRHWVVWRAGHAMVRGGLYLDALEAMFAAQRPQTCSRPDPRLANSPLSR